MTLLQDRCSFCLRPKEKTKVLIRSIANKERMICDSCVTIFKQMNEGLANARK